MTFCISAGVIILLSLGLIAAACIGVRLKTIISRRRNTSKHPCLKMKDRNADDYPVGKEESCDIDNPKGFRNSEDLQYQELDTQVHPSDLYSMCAGGAREAPQNFSSLAACDHVSATQRHDIHTFNMFNSPPHSYVNDIELRINEEGMPRDSDGYQSINVKENAPKQRITHVYFNPNLHCCEDTSNGYCNIVVEKQIDTSSARLDLDKHVCHQHEQDTISSHEPHLYVELN